MNFVYDPMVDFNELVDVGNIPPDQYVMFGVKQRTLFYLASEYRLRRTLGEVHVSLEKRADDFVFVGPILVSQIPQLLEENDEDIIC